ncbi:MAG: hypothetical protein JWN04_388, partial [Myxococcaceae bacterium]|nr:hypothetical protein [Myxococcaceae bacterium]
RKMREALTRMNDVEYPKLNEIGGALAAETEFPRAPVIEGRRRTKTVAKGEAR